MIKTNGKNRISAFTMVELLIVISLIGILSGLILTIIQPGKLRADARDAQRLSDLRVVQGALEMYFADNRSYPKSCTPQATCTASWIYVNGSTDPLSSALLSTYMSEMKIDPTNNGTTADPCASATIYRYNYWSNGSIYFLTAILENSANMAKSCVSSSLPNYTSCATASVCTVVRNP